MQRDGIRSDKFTSYFHRIASQPTDFRFTYAYDQVWMLALVFSFFHRSQITVKQTLLPGDVHTPAR